MSQASATGLVRVHRRLAVAVPRLRYRRPAALRRGLDRARRGGRLARRRPVFHGARGICWWRGMPPEGRTAVSRRRRSYRQPQPESQTAPRSVRPGMAGGRAAALRRRVAEFLAGPRSGDQRQVVRARGRLGARAADPRRRAGAACPAAGHPPRRRPQGGEARPAEARERGLGRRGWAPVVSGSTSRSRRGSTSATCSALDLMTHDVQPSRVIGAEGDLRQRAAAGQPGHLLRRPARFPGRRARRLRLRCSRCSTTKKWDRRPITAPSRTC